MSQLLEQLVKNSTKVRTLLEAAEIIGSKGRGSTIFSDVTKMPCFTYSLPATMCRTGSKLRKIEGSVCSDCYACPQESMNTHLGGWYGTERVEIPMYHRLLQVLFNPRWTEAMIFIFKYYKYDLFRWHDSGDIQNYEHFENLCKIADAVPETIFWLPTQEWQILIDYWERHGRKPLKELHPNLIIRISARLKDSSHPTLISRMIGVATSRVSTKKNDVDCPAMNQGHNCCDCRKCFDYGVESVTYQYHDGHDNILESDFMKKIRAHMHVMMESGETEKGQIYAKLSEIYHIKPINIRILARKERIKLEKRLAILQEK